MEYEYYLVTRLLYLMEIWASHKEPSTLKYKILTSKS